MATPRADSASIASGADLYAGARAPMGTVVQYLTHDGDAVGNVNNSSAPTNTAWNKCLALKWRRGVWGDWMDAAQTQFGVSISGAVPYASFAIPAPGAYTVDISTLAARWLAGDNRGCYLRMRLNDFPVRFRGRTAAIQGERPNLQVVTSAGTFNCQARANACWATSTVSIVSSSAAFVLSSQQPAIVQFDLSAVTGTFVSAELQLTDYSHDTGSSSALGVVDVFEADPPAFVVPDDVALPVEGIAANYASFAAMAEDAAVIESNDFATPGVFDNGWDFSPERLSNPASGTTYARGQFVEGSNSSANLKRLLMRSATPGATGGEGMDVQRDEAYCQYYLYLEDDWGSTSDGIKIPAMGCQFGYWNAAGSGYWQNTGGNGGTPSDGLKKWNAAQNRWEYMGHSTRILTTMRPADDSAYANLYGLQLYPYNLDQAGPFPASEVFPYVLIRRGRWYAVDLFMKQNSIVGPYDGLGNGDAVADGEYRVWINGHPAYSKDTFRWRRHPEFGVEGFWLDFYHGGVPPAPYAMHYGIDRVTLATSYIGPM